MSLSRGERVCKGNDGPRLDVRLACRDLVEALPGAGVLVGMVAQREAICARGGEVGGESAVRWAECARAEAGGGSRYARLIWEGVASGVTPSAW